MLEHLRRLNSAHCAVTQTPGATITTRLHNERAEELWQEWTRADTDMEPPFLILL